MRLLAEIRASRASIRLDEAGKLLAQGVPPELLEQAKAERQELIETLKKEAFDGIQYHDSAYLVWLENLWECAQSAGRFEIVQAECLALIALCWEIDDAFYVSLENGIATLGKHRARIEELADTVVVKSGWLLEGARLRQAVIDEMVTPSTVNMEALA